jgi:hypothetical protein
MGRPERRKYPRVQIYDPISYVGIGSQGIHVGQNIGVARDVSLNGIRIESVCDIETRKIVLTFVDMDQKFNEIPGKVIYSRKNKAGNFEIGISLQGKRQENINFTKKLVQHYHYNKQNSRLITSPSDLHQG